MTRSIFIGLMLLGSATFAADAPQPTRDEVLAEIRTKGKWRLVVSHVTGIPR